MDEEDLEYRLTIRHHPWEATLEPLGTPAKRESGGKAGGEKPLPERFTRPLDLLERLEREGGPPRGLK